MPIDVRLVLLSPSFILSAVQTGLCARAEFADDERLLIGDLPLGFIGAVRMAFVPSDVFVDADDVEGLVRADHQRSWYCLAHAPAGPR